MKHDLEDSWLRKADYDPENFLNLAGLKLQALS